MDVHRHAWFLVLPNIIYLEFLAVILTERSALMRTFSKLIFMYTLIRQTRYTRFHAAQRHGWLVMMLHTLALPRQDWRPLPVLCHGVRACKHVWEVGAKSVDWIDLIVEELASCRTLKDARRYSRPARELYVREWVKKENGRGRKEEHVEEALDLARPRREREACQDREIPPEH
jgi:hypothetical protein